MSNSHKRNKNHVGEKNSQFGTCWITNGEINKKIDKSELQKYVIEGWRTGRINVHKK
jgi:hypothetical protein